MPEKEERPLLRLLIIDDSEDDAWLLLRRFATAGYRCEHVRVEDRPGMRDALARQPWDAVLSDHRMPTFSSVEALQLLQELNIDLPFIIVSGYIDEETAVAAMRAGAHDYLSKDRLDRLVPAVERELRDAKHRDERRAALDAVRESEARFRALVANIPGMVFQMAREPDGNVRFLYVSDGATAVLGIRSQDLLAQAQLFVAAMVAQDRDAFLSAMADSAREFSTVNWEGRVRTPSGDIKWLNLRSSPRLTDAGEQIWEGVVFNITQSKETERELRGSRAQLAELSSHLQAAKEDERERIARDIHDVLGSTLVAIKFEVALLGGKIPGDPLQLRKRVRSIEKLTDDAIATVGRVARELRPGILKDFGLAAAIECQAQDFAQRTGISCRILCVDHDIEPDEETSTALFRIFQEALTNIGKHANARKAEVRLVQEGNEIVLEVCDDGRGLDGGDLVKPRSYGLRGMRERIHSLNGTFEISRLEPTGTRLCVRAPVTREQATAGADAETD